MQGRSPEELIQAAERAMGARDPAAALALVRQAEAAGPATERTRMLAAAALRATGDLTGAVNALDDVLAEQPYHFVALLSKGAILDQAGGRGAALDVYRNAIKIAPPEDRIPPAAARQLEAARQIVDQASHRLREHLAGSVAHLRNDLKAEDLARFDEAVDILSGVKRAYVHEPLFFNYPRLPAIPFFDRRYFPWLEELEAAGPVIEAEMHGALKTATEAELAPYIQYPKGAPVNQWGELNHSRRWSSYFLWRDGQRQDAACAQCPGTAEVLGRLPMCDQAGFAPTAMFSALEAKTHIPPHTGSSNSRLLVHLPLLLPGPARFRVGNETREWKMGEAWVFDDTIEHEAWNDADSLRVILIFDVWNPLISETERPLINAMLAASNTFVP
ncbi:aspartyl/asparaginyl beta-hydroxylase domain-containing protein [Brevundimonas aveniformis]|uniref:aspartyl/asparaginyl beta-hydroxylase domain-containing protein n=1 Tax=Brevundimonas aveniformis TaxID=370977 RepID=UPI000428C8A1|nr:aspartyl/asparaginyl beta-hydroxylase domain-containing protein [Brevundimonas aveniformis]